MGWGGAYRYTLSTESGKHFLLPKINEGGDPKIVTFDTKIPIFKQKLKVHRSATENSTNYSTSIAVPNMTYLNKSMYLKTNGRVLNRRGNIPFEATAKVK